MQAMYMSFAILPNLGTNVGTDSAPLVVGDAERIDDGGTGRPA